MVDTSSTKCPWLGFLIERDQWDNLTTSDANSNGYPPPSSCRITFLVYALQSMDQGSMKENEVLNFEKNIKPHSGTNENSFMHLNFTRVVRNVPNPGVSKRLYDSWKVQSIR